MKERNRNLISGENDVTHSFFGGTGKGESDSLAQRARPFASRSYIGTGALEESHPQPEEVQAIRAPEIPDSEGGTKSEEPRQASLLDLPLPDLLLTKAKQTGAPVTFIEDGALLESMGGVAAFLRSRA